MLTNSYVKKMKQTGDIFFTCTVKTYKWPDKYLNIFIIMFTFVKKNWKSINQLHDQWYKVLHFGNNYELCIDLLYLKLLITSVSVATKCKILFVFKFSL